MLENIPNDSIDYIFTDPDVYKRQRCNTPAKLNNFKLTFEEIDKLAEQITLIKAIAEYVTFKTDCACLLYTSRCV